MKKRWLKGLLAVLLISGVGLMGCKNDPEPGSKPRPQFGTDYDVIVVGGGMSGAAATYAAAKGGAKVLLLEKRRVLGGASGGGSMGATNSIIQQTASPPIVDTDQSWIEKWKKRDDQLGYINPAEIRYADMAALKWLVGNSAGSIKYLIDAGGVISSRPWAMSQDLEERYHNLNVNGRNVAGAGIARFFAEKAEEFSAEVYLNTRVLRLLQEGGPGSRITGVELDDGTVINAKAVILAAGGFRSDINAWIDSPEPIRYSVQNGADGTNTGWEGEGILMAEAAGGELWDDPWVIGIGTQFAATIERGDEGLWVDAKTGNRVGFEGAMTSVRTGWAMIAQRNGSKLYAIVASNFFEEQPNPNAPLIPEGWVRADNTGVTADGLSARTLAAVSAPGAELIYPAGPIFKANTIAELAAAAGINASGLQKAIDTYHNIADAINARNASYPPITPSNVLANRNAAYDAGYAGLDPLDADELSNTNRNTNPLGPGMGFLGSNNTRKTYMKITTPPFYAVEVLPDVMGTFGGIKTEYETARVRVAGNLDTFIPGLYAVGENANRSLYGRVYLSGSSSIYCITSGRIAGEHAANFVKQ